MAGNPNNDDQAVVGALSIFEFKMIDVVMCVAVLIDATLVRGILLPAGLSLLGGRLWRPSVPPAPERPVSPALSRQ